MAKQLTRARLLLNPPAAFWPEEGEGAAAFRPEERIAAAKKNLRKFYISGTIEIFELFNGSLGLGF